MRLRMVGYHRLLGDLQPLVKRDDQGRPGSQFREGTTLELVWRRYCFDRRLRLLLLDAIERFEVAVRERLVHHLVRRHGPYGYLKREICPADVGLPADFSSMSLWAESCARQRVALRFALS